MLSDNPKNAMSLYDFLLVEQIEKNVKLSTKITHIKVIYLFNRFLHFKDFGEITKHDILNYLNSPKKSDTDDPSHKGIGTYNTRQMILINSLGGYVDNLNKMYKKKKVLQMRMLERLLRR